MKKDKVLSRIIVFFYVFINFYYIYRYILQYNSALTSPTYSNTPAIFQDFKYYIAFLICILGIYVLLYFHIKIKIYKLEILFIFLALFFCIKSFITSDYSLLIKYFTFAAVAYFVLFIENTDDLGRKILLVNQLILLYHIVYSLIQIFLYLGFKRLPALAYDNGYVRFGGGWDDPNSFGIYLCLPIIYLLTHFFEVSKEWKKTALLSICIVLEILTISMAGYCGLCICLLAVALRYKKDINWRIIIYGFVGLIVFVALKFPFFYQIYKWKSGSIKLHLKMILPELANNDLISILFGGNRFESSENFYNIILKNTGVLSWTCVLIIVCYGIYVSYIVYIDKGRDRYSFCCMVYLIAFSVAQIGIPYSICVPVNYIYWFIYFMELNLYRKRKSNCNFCEVQL